jgi:hypothetical protein
MILGEDIEVLSGERHSEHIPTHLILLDKGEIPPDIHKRAAVHIEKHMEFLNQDQQLLGSMGGQVSAANRQAQPELTDEGTVTGGGLRESARGAAPNQL